MKYLILITILIFSTNLLAKNNFNLKVTGNPYYVGVKVGTDYSEETLILDIQPASEIVGKNGRRYEIQLGLSTETTRRRDIAKIFFYGWNNPEKNNELGLGLGGHYIFRPYDSDFGIILGGKAGVGKQNVKGTFTTLSTNANKVSFVMSTDQVKTPTKIEYLKDTYVISIALITGFSYTLTEDIELEFNLEYRQENYQVGYINEGSNINNSITFKQDVWNSGISLSYSF